MWGRCVIVCPFPWRRASLLLPNPVSAFESTGFPRSIPARKNDACHPEIIVLDGEVPLGGLQVAHG